MGEVYLARSRSTQQAFAVKRATLTDPEQRPQFLAELRTWIDLPDHPHLVACHFFHTVNDEVFIFADYVEGGSLADWIQSRGITRLRDILDAAIQFAWGLDALHQLGLVHQDVKPSNALVAPSTEGEPERFGDLRVSDFGMTRARKTAGLAGGEASEGVSADVTSAGKGTQYYRSPEQASGSRVSHRSDVWSWGVSVFEMFTGKVTWLSGVVVRESLQAYLTDGPQADLPPMPAGVAEVLERCFEGDPAKRWDRLSDAAGALAQVHQDELGCPYPRQPPTTSTPATDSIVRDRRSRFAAWDDPVAWLLTALDAVGRRSSKAWKYQPPRGSLKAQAIDDLAVFEQARQLLEEAIANGRREFRFTLARMWSEKSLAHVGAEDLPGAVDSMQSAIDGFEQLVERDGRWDLAKHLAIACMNKGLIVRNLGKLHEAVALNGRAIEILEQLVDQEGQRDLADSLALSYINKAVALHALGDLHGAMAPIDRGVQVLEQLVEHEGRLDLDNHLARACVNKALTMRALGNIRGAVPFYDRAIEIRERLVERERRWVSANDLANVCMNKAVALQALGDLPGAIVLYERSIEIREKLVEREGRRELVNDLATALMNKAMAVKALGDIRGAIALYNRVIEIREQLVEREGRRELAPSLAKACLNKAVALGVLGDHREASVLLDRAIAILERLVEHDGRRELANDLASALMNKAAELHERGDLRGAIEPADRAIEIWEQLVEREGRRYLADDLAEALVNKAVLVDDLGDRREAISLCDRAIEILEQLTEGDGRRESRSLLARACTVKAAPVFAIEDHRGAIALLDRAIEILEQLVGGEERRGLQSHLARALHDKSVPVNALGDHHGAIVLLDRAIEILERVMKVEWRREFGDLLVLACTKKLHISTATGNLRSVVDSCDRAIEILEEVHRRKHQLELVSFLGQIRDIRIDASLGTMKQIESAPESDSRSLTAAIADVPRSIGVLLQRILRKGASSDQKSDSSSESELHSPCGVEDRVKGLIRHGRVVLEHEFEGLLKEAQTDGVPGEQAREELARVVLDNGASFVKTEALYCAPSSRVISVLLDVGVMLLVTTAVCVAVVEAPYPKAAQTIMNLPWGPELPTSLPAMGNDLFSFRFILSSVLPGYCYGFALAILAPVLLFRRTLSEIVLGIQPRCAKDLALLPRRYCAVRKTLDAATLGLSAFLRFNAGITCVSDGVVGAVSTREPIPTSLTLPEGTRQGPLSCKMASLMWIAGFLALSGWMWVGLPHHFNLGILVVPILGFLGWALPISARNGYENASKFIAVAVILSWIFLQMKYGEVGQFSFQLFVDRTWLMVCLHGLAAAVVLWIVLAYYFVRK